MTFKTLFLILIFISSLNASFQKVKIGTIDSYYDDKITKEQLYTIIKEIEHDFETQLNQQVFDYAEDGQPINFLYLPPTSLEKSILRKTKRIKEKKEEINNLIKFFPGKKEKIEVFKNSLTKEQYSLNKEVKTYNNYINDINRKKELTMSEFNKVKEYSIKEKKRLDNEIKKIKGKNKELSKIIRTFNSNVSRYNTLIRDYNRLSVELESMNRHYTKVQGRTYGFQKIEKKTIYKNGEKKEEKNFSTTMNKIEIYGFKNLKELKIILAHELAHLVGLPHIEVKDSLMNPIIQEKQVLKGLVLTPADIKLFKKYY